MRSAFRFLLVVCLAALADRVQAQSSTQSDRDARRGYKLENPAADIATPPASVPNQTQTTKADTWAGDLGRGEVAINVGGGIKFGSGGAAKPAGSADVVVGLSRWFAGVGTYAYNDFGRVGRLHGTANEFMGAFRATLPNRRISPFVQLGAGAVLYSVGASGVSVGTTKLAISPGGGANVSFNRRVAMSLEFRGIRPVTGAGHWYLRPTIGVWFRIGKISFSD